MKDDLRGAAGVSQSSAFEPRDGPPHPADFALRGLEPQQRPRQCRFAGPGFADDGERPPLPQHKADAVHGELAPIRDPEAFARQRLGRVLGATGPRARRRGVDEAFGVGLARRANTAAVVPSSTTRPARIT